jgi:phage/plasmid-like protein (TIGR03299 family)
MPAYFDTGFSVRKPMWHRQGIVLGEYPTDWADAREKAGLMWEPEERPHFVVRYRKEFRTCRGCDKPIGRSHTVECEVGGVANRLQVELLDAVPEGSQLTADGEYIFVLDPDHKDIVRDDTFDVLGVGGAEYSSITHGKRENGASMEQIVETFVGLGGVKFETGGSLRGGKAVWSLMYLDEPYRVAGDTSEHLPFMALVNFHDGNGACKLIETQVRIVCWNTLQMSLADADRTGRQMIFRHTGNVEERIAEAKESMTQLRTEVLEYQDMAATLVALPVGDKELDMYLSEFIPNPAENAVAVSPRVQDNVDKARARFKQLYEESATCADVAGTAYGLIQASTEYLDHVRAYRSADTYLGRSILKPEPAKTKALAIAGRMFEDGLARLDTEWSHRLLDLGVEDTSLAKTWAPRATKTLTNA